MRAVAWHHSLREPAIWRRSALIALAVVVIVGAFWPETAVAGGVVAMLACVLAQAWLFVDLRDSQERAGRN